MNMLIILILESSHNVWASLVTQMVKNLPANQRRNKKNPDYYAHGKSNNPINYAYGIQIPFFVYASPLYQQKHPETMERIKNRQNNPISWNSDDLPYFIMDLIGIKEINGEDVRAKSAI